jgi:hypothetical protein
MDQPTESESSLANVLMLVMVVVVVAVVGNPMVQVGWEYLAQLFGGMYSSEAASAPIKSPFHSP